MALKQLTDEKGNPLTRSVDINANPILSKDEISDQSTAEEKQRILKVERLIKAGKISQDKIDEWRKDHPAPTHDVGPLPAIQSAKPMSAVERHKALIADHLRNQEEARKKAAADAKAEILDSKDDAALLSGTVKPPSGKVSK